MVTHLVIKDGSIIGDVDLKKRPSVLPFACFPGFSFVEEGLVKVGDFKDLRSDVRSALLIGVYTPGGVCLPVYPIRSSKGLVIYQVNSPDDEGFRQAHQRQADLKSFPGALGLLAFIDWKKKTFVKSGAASLGGYDYKDRASRLYDALSSYQFNLKKAKITSDEDLTLWVLAAFTLDVKFLFSSLLVDPS